MHGTQGHSQTFTGTTRVVVRTATGQRRGVDVAAKPVVVLRKTLEGAMQVPPTGPGCVIIVEIWGGRRRPRPKRLFEERCAEAFRSLGFDVQELGQGCGRVADCLAVATAERFAVVIDAKVRRRGYTLGTDDRQFCEYATSHARELALSGIDKVYFAVVGSGFRQEDLDKLARFMAGTPIRSVVFIEAQALMRLVNDSIRDRRKYRLAEIDQLLFGNKIIDK